MHGKPTSQNSHFQVINMAKKMPLKASIERQILPIKTALKMKSRSARNPETFFPVRRPYEALNIEEAPADQTLERGLSL